ncbi:uncharacterized protein LOC116302562 [Actinia tenebrosa]|uniref:Uncharacterized protein LOC116302562 n=1 Tax=Actinia tenebrosa TaxID=6105 RepID=A0A6P8ILQ8_ACTTE|nr:uncharacterized protein LOC116302562 [Actinia tenebrosa]
MPFYKLDGNIIQAIAVPNILQCCWKCDRLPECFSLNVADVPDKDGLYECQMLRTETNKYSALLKQYQHYHHYTRFKCETTRCLNGGTCQNEGYDDFRCLCQQEFTGHMCDVHVTQPKTYEWLKINASPVCFGARNDSYGSFYMKINGTAVHKLKLIHLSGYVTCHKEKDERKSNWGCRKNSDKLWTIITDSTNQRILPQDGAPQYSRYSIPGFTSSSHELIFENFTSPMVITTGQEYRIWYTEDLRNDSESDNGGTSCADVYVFGLFG